MTRQANCCAALRPRERPSAPGAAGAILAHESRMARLRELLAAGPQMASELADKLFDQEDRPADRRRYLDALVTAGSRITGPDGLPCCPPATTSSSAPPRAPTPACRRRARTSRSPATSTARSAAPSPSSSAPARGAALFTYPERSELTPACSPWARRSQASRARGFSSTQGTRRHRRGRRDPRGAAGQARLEGRRAVRVVRRHLRRLAHDLRPGRLRRHPAAAGPQAEHPRGDHHRLPGLRRPGRRRWCASSRAAATPPPRCSSTSLYQALPPAPDPEQADQPGEGRKLLLFSDSRQAAAFFAPYLENSYRAAAAPPADLEGLQRAAPADEREHRATSSITSPRRPTRRTCSPRQDVRPGAASGRPRCG